MLKSLELLNARISECHQCSLRHEYHRPVLGVGSAKPKVFVILEKPSRDSVICESIYADTAVLRLRKLLQEAGVMPHEYYLSLMTRCNPGNIRPTSREAKVCYQWICEEISVLHPQILLPMGQQAINLAASLNIVTMKSKSLQQISMQGGKADLMWVETLRKTLNAIREKNCCQTQS